MNKIFFIVAIALLINFNSISQNSWQIVDPPVNTDFVSVCFTDEAHGWIISEDGFLVKTTDGGITWNIFNPFQGFQISSLHFSDENHGCMVGSEIVTDSSLILVTSDGGENWTFGNHEKVNGLNDVFFINNDKGWAVGSRESYNMNCCLHTLDGGNTWTIQESILVAGAELFGVHFRDENNGQICGTDGAFFLTNNGGGTGWALGISMPIVNLNDIFNFGTLGGCIVGDGGKLLYTINNWYQYIEQNSNTIENLNGVSGYGETNEVWAVGDNGTIIYTSNYLLGWTTQASGVTENLNDVCMINNNNGWSVGDNGTILYFGSPTSISQHNATSEIEIYPNPVSDIFYIKAKDINTLQKIEVFSLEGALLFQTQSDISQNVAVDVSSFPSGLYYVRIFNDMEFIIKKILVK